MVDSIMASSAVGIDTTRACLGQLLAPTTYWSRTVSAAGIGNSGRRYGAGMAEEVRARGEEARDLTPASASGNLFRGYAIAPTVRFSLTFTYTPL